MKILRKIPELTKPGDIKTLAVFYHTKGSCPLYTIRAFEKYYEIRGIKVISIIESLNLIDENKVIDEAIELLLTDILRCDTIAFADNWHRMPLAYTVYMLCREFGIRIIKVGTFDELHFKHQIEISEIDRKFNYFNEYIPRKGELENCKVKPRNTTISEKS